jgi:hypothetical protein
MNQEEANFSPTSSHHPSMSTYSTSPILHSSSSISAEDNYQFVDETDEIVFRGYYPGTASFRDHTEEGDKGTSLWHDLDRDGINTPAIPSFILDSPPIGPMNLEGRSEVTTIHSLRKGTLIPSSFFV